MNVKIDSNYSPAEIQALLASLVTSGFLTPADLTQQAAQLGDWAICFLDINSLLLPFRDNFVWYAEWQKRAIFYDVPEVRVGFYTALTERLLQACPLSRFQPTCQLEVEAAPDLAILRTGAREASFSYANYDEYLTRVVTALNTLLAAHDFDAAYYEVEFDDGSGFLLLTAQQYNYLLTNRIIRFEGVLYPEIEAWRATVREEGLLF